MSSAFKRLRTLLISLGLVAVACTTKEPAPPGGQSLNIEHLAGIKWSPALPGIEVAVLSGNPEGAGQPYSMLIKCADGAGTKPHTHPTDGDAVVLQGSYVLGIGSDTTSAKQESLSVGDFVHVPKTVAHFDTCKGETILYAHGVGPLAFNWVNPADDPARVQKPQ